MFRQKGRNSRLPQFQAREKDREFCIKLGKSVKSQEILFCNYMVYEKGSSLVKVISVISIGIYEGTNFCGLIAGWRSQGIFFPNEL